jgi:putative tryptophan/tyrosine transport system substrate-binding protein
VRRREVIAVFGGVVLWPLVARGQNPTMPVVGFLSDGAAGPYAGQLAAFRQGLGEAGFIEGQNVAVEYRWADGQSDRLPAMAAELVSRQVAVIAATTLPAAPAAKAATTTIPIVFLVGGDPVELGLVASMNRPAGNLTGVAVLNVMLVAKRLELLHELVPASASIAMLINPSSPYAEPEIRAVKAAAQASGQQLILLNAATEHEIEAAFDKLSQRKAALLVSADPFFTSERDRVVTLAARHAIPAIYQWREFITAGGLISYGANRTDIYRQAGIYVGRILNGAKPADLPVAQPTKFELVINLKTAKALGLAMPASILARADEVIE